MYTYQLAAISVGNCKDSTGKYYSVIIMTSKLNLIKIRLINFDFGKRLKILRVFADVSITRRRPGRNHDREAVRVLVVRRFDF